MAETNGKWSLAFWVVTVICGLGLLTLTTNVIANDRVRQLEDQRIESNMERLMEFSNNRLVRIMGDLREIKAKMGIKTVDYRGTINT